MRIIPVLDVMSGVTVHAVAGRRQEYRPVVSRLTPSSDPLALAQAFRDQLGCWDVYVADLDAICHGCRNPQLYRALAETGLRVWLDAGLRTLADGLDLERTPVAKIVLGSETLEGPEVVRGLLTCMHPDRLVFSVDLRQGQPICLPGWQASSAMQLIEEVVRLGITTFIFLDLARVGTGTGLGTEHLCADVKRRWPTLRIVLGGGIRDGDDLHRAAACGADAVLVASALHDGRLTQSDLAPFLR